MKNNILRKIIVLSFVLITTSCNTSTSVKGKWSKEEKEKLKSEISKKAEEDEDYKELKKNKEWKKLYNKIIECIVENIESKYNNYDEADKDEKGLEKIGESCGEEVMSNYLESAFDNLDGDNNSDATSSSTPDEDVTE
jgi:hypothetical protein